MAADFIARGGILRVVGGNFDGAAVRVEPEVMRGLLTRETHDVVSAGVHIVGVLVVILSWLFRRFILSRAWAQKQRESRDRHYELYRVATLAAIAW